MKTQMEIYAARNWEMAQRVKKTRPYLLYTAIVDSNTQPKCLKLNNIVRLIDDVFWKHFYPWGHCRCSTMSLNSRDLVKMGLKVTEDKDLPDFVRERLFGDSK